MLNRLRENAYWIKKAFSGLNMPDVFELELTTTISKDEDLRTIHNFNDLVLYLEEKLDHGG